MDNIEQERKKIPKMTDAELQDSLLQYEFDRMVAINILGSNHPRTELMALILDAIIGEIVRRDREKVMSFRKEYDEKVVNQPNAIFYPMPKSPEAPDTFYKLMALGDGKIENNN